MCLIALALGVSQRFPFVIAANRDEFLERPTAALAHWKTPSGTAVLSGRDLEAGGIWMGFAANGRFAMLTNVRQPHAKPPILPISRGTLALTWLDSTQGIAQFAAQLDGQCYQGFNLIAGDARSQQCFYLSNQVFSKPFEGFEPVIPAQGAIDIAAYNMPWNAVYGLSNAALDTHWPKTMQLKSALQRSLQAANAAALARQCLTALADSCLAAQSDLPSTGVSKPMEWALSSVFVQWPREPSAAFAASPPSARYGTRSSLAAVLEQDGTLLVQEATHSHDGQPAHVAQHHFADWALPSA